MDTGPTLAAHPQAGNLSASPAAPAHAHAPLTLRVERLDTSDAILTAVRQASLSAATGFQSADWLTAVYRHLVPATGTPFGLVIRSAQTGDLLAMLPLYTCKHGPLTVAKFADCGVSDYNAVLTGLPANDHRIGDADLLAAIKSACHGIDILALERMTATSPLADHPSATPARLFGNTLTIDTTVDDYIRARGKKYRKEAERSFRVLETHGAWSFQRAETPQDIAEGFCELERQQAARHVDKGDQYALAAPHYAAFYRDLLDASPDTTHLFTLKVNGVIMAVLLGITHRDTFTLLRIANGGEAWRQVSPGRLIVIEAMRYFCPRGVTTFDMGMGDYAFKRNFGTQPTPLTDLIVPMSWRGIPVIAAHRLKDRLRENDTLRSAVRTVKSRLSTFRA